jgi:predicted DsbA family dithiol-disulfide isomerase
LNIELNHKNGMNKPVIEIDVVSDVVCPWCFIGKRRLENALGQLADRYEFKVQYLPFELNPDLPTEGVNQYDYLTQKFGGEDRYQQVTAHVSRIAEEEGLHFDFEAQTTSPNTFEAHRILWFAGREGKQVELAEAFFKAYFEQGVDMSKAENLLEIATSVGLDRSAVESFLASADGKIEVRQLQSRNRQMGVTGVPFYIINKQYGLSGAQPTEVFVQTLNEIGEG